MKCNRHTIKLTLAFFAMFALTACVNTLDEEDFKTTFRVEGGEECALFFKIETGEDDMDTRASGDLVNGSESEKEYQIGENGNYAFFFKTDGSWYRTEELTLYDAADNDCGEVTDNTPSAEKHQVEKIYRTRLNLRDSNGEIEQELLCLVVLNGDPIIKELRELEKRETTALSKFLEFSWKYNGDPMGIGRDGDLFTMTNSSYVDGGEVCCAVPIDVEALYTPLEVDGVAPQKIVTIHVERMLAKFTFEIDGSKFTEVRDENGNLYYEIEPTNHVITYCSGVDPDNGDSPILKEVDFKIRVTGWGINALERESYAYKKINNINTPQNPDGYFTNWNDAGNYRSYWAEDAHYDVGFLHEDNEGEHYNPDFYTSYPWQFRRSVNNGVSFDYYDKHIDNTNGNSNGNFLWNYSFTKLNNHDFGRKVYVPENTYDATQVSDWGHDNRENVLAGTHLIIGAELLTNLDGSGYKPNELWRDRTGVYYSDSTLCFWSLVRSFNLALQSHLYMDYTRLMWWMKDGVDIEPRSALTMSGDYLREKEGQGNRKPEDKTYNKYSGAEYCLWFWDASNTTQKRTPITSYKAVQDYEGNLFRPAIITAGDGQVLPWPDPENDDCMTIRGKNDPNKTLEIYKSIAIEYSISSNEKEGYAGMRVVIGERRREDVESRDVKSMLYEWTGAVDHFKDGKMYYAAPAELAGAGGAASIYGVVRNGWYKYKLSGIQVIGTSVDNVDEPIVPNKVITHDQLNITVDIIDWHNFWDIWAPIL